MRGERTGETYRLGDKVEVKLVEAAPVAGALRFELLTKGRFTGKARLRGRAPSTRRAGLAPARRPARAQRLPTRVKVKRRAARLTFEGLTMSLTIETARPARSDEVKAIPAMKRGFLGRCPACGKGRLFGRFLKVDRPLRGLRDRVSSPPGRRPAALYRHLHRRPRDRLWHPHDRDQARDAAVGASRRLAGPDAHPVPGAAPARERRCRGAAIRARHAWLRGGPDEERYRRGRRT